MEEYSVLGEEDENESVCSLSEIQKNLCHAFDYGQKDHLEVFLRIKPMTKEVGEQDDQKYLDVESQQAVVVHPLKDPVVPPPSLTGAGMGCGGARNRQHVTGGNARPGQSTTSMQNNAQQHSLRFTFSRVFDEKTDQKYFFDEAVQSTVREFLDGQNCLLFAYGVTNSGKTHTMQGTPSDAGVVPRTFDVIFNSIGQRLYGRSDLKPSRFCDVESLDHEAESREVMLKESILRQIYVKHKKALSINFSASSSDVSKSNLQLNDESGKDITGATEEEEEISTIVANRRREQTQVDVRGSSKQLFSVWASFAEVYNEQVYDLLVPPPEDVKVRRLRTTNGTTSGLSRQPSTQGRAGANGNAFGHQRTTKSKAFSPPHFGRKERLALQLKEDVQGRPYIHGLREVNVTSADEAFKLLTLGRRNLQMAYTKLNDTSSRSHCIFTLKLMRVVESSDGSEIRHTKFNILSLCDLAGIERSCKTHNVGERMKEAGNINNSLFILGRCLQAIRHNQVSQTSDRQLLPPFRESKLTRLFQSFLTGKGRAKMIVTVSQSRSMYPENLNAIRFSAIAKQVTLVPAQVYPIEVAKPAINPELQKHKFNPRDTIEWATGSEMKRHKSDPHTGMEKATVAEEDEDSDNEDSQEDSTINEDDESNESSDDSQSEINVDSISRDELLIYSRKLEDKIKVLRQENASLEKRIEKINADTQQEFKSLHAKYEGLLERAELRHEEAMDKKVELMTDAYERVLKRQRCDDDVETRESMLSRIKELEEDLQNSNQELQNWKQNYQLLNNEVQSLTQEVTEVKFQAAADKMQISNRCSSFEMENLELRVQLDKIKEQVEDQDSKHKIKVTDLETKVDQLEKMNNSLLADLNDQNVLLASKNDEISKLRYQNMELQERVVLLESIPGENNGDERVSKDGNTTNKELSHLLNNMSLDESKLEAKQENHIKKFCNNEYNDYNDSLNDRKDLRSNDYDSCDSSKDLFSDSLNFVYSKKKRAYIDSEDSNSGPDDASFSAGIAGKNETEATVDYQGDESENVSDGQRSLTELKHGNVVSCFEPPPLDTKDDKLHSKCHGTEYDSVPYIDQSRCESSGLESEEVAVNVKHSIVAEDDGKSSSKFSLSICPKTPNMVPPLPPDGHLNSERPNPDRVYKTEEIVDSDESKFVKPHEIVIASLYKSTKKALPVESDKTLRTSSRRVQGKTSELMASLSTRSAAKLKASDTEDSDFNSIISAKSTSKTKKTKQATKSKKKGSDEDSFDKKENPSTSRSTRKMCQNEAVTTGKKKRNLFKISDDPLLDIPQEGVESFKEDESQSPLSSLKRHLRSRKM